MEEKEDYPNPCDSCGSKDTDFCPEAHGFKCVEKMKYEAVHEKC